jgi:hypothetical protein
MSNEPETETADDSPNALAYLPYPSSTLSPRIVPTDLSSFKSRGVSQVERDLQQKLVELRETYLEAIDHFNWNKLVYESEINFEPVVGETYHLYESRGRRVLSMIAPGQWPMRFLATVRLDVDRQWKVEKTADDINVEEFFAPGAQAPDAG